MKAAAKGILAQVAMDKQAVHLSPDQSSQDVVRIRNGMPGVVTLKLGDVVIPGLRITVGKLQLQANEETTVLFEWRPNDPGPQCQDCATKIGNSTIALQVVQTGRLLPINIFFDRGPQAAAPTPRPASQAPQK
jgi:hypothetical protein